jgi:alkaline phosphatase D
MNRERSVPALATGGARRGADRPVLVSLAVWIAALLPVESATAAGPSGFSLGVAAGDVGDTTAIVWTRADWLCVVWFELATDEAFATIEQSADILASVDNDFIVKLELTDLSPATGYFYRFGIIGDPESASRIGRFRTAPASDEAATLRFVFSGDVGFTSAPFPILSQVADEEADFLLWFGDTIYADDPAAISGIATTLDEYRVKYQEIRSDPHVQEALAATPLRVGWDDHEVTDNYAGTDPTLPADQLEAAYRAFFEYMPLEDQQMPEDPFRTYRRFGWGSQVEFFLLDGRQYREPSAQAICGSNPDPLGTLTGPLLADPVCTQALSRQRSMLGQEQFDWLTKGLAESTATVKVVVNNVPFSYLGLLPYDRWDGYDAERRALLEFINAKEIGGVLFLTTDFHSNWYNPDVTRHFRDRSPDYDLPNDVPVAEAIVGPIGVETLHESVLGLVTHALGLPNGLLIRGVLTGLERQVTRRLRCASGFTLTETNRVSYVVVDVSPSGEVEVTYRGAAPDDARNPDTAVETFYTTSDDPPPSLPCCLPILLLVFGGSLFAKDLFGFLNPLGQRF